MKIKFLLALAVASVMSFSSAWADGTKYHAGETQDFTGLVCRSEGPARHIFDVWMEAGVDTAKEVFNLYKSANQCKFFERAEAYFIERITSGEALNFNGKDVNVIVFSVSPGEMAPEVDFLVTWEDLGESVLR